MQLTAVGWPADHSVIDSGSFFATFGVFINFLMCHSSSFLLYVSGGVQYNDSVSFFHASLPAAAETASLLCRP